jgi:hypothetical protein
LSSVLISKKEFSDEVIDPALQEMIAPITPYLPKGSSRIGDRAIERAASSATRLKRTRSYSHLASELFLRNR